MLTLCPCVPGLSVVEHGPMDRLFELLKQHAFRRGRFVLSSGKESDFFIDCKAALLTAEGHARVGAALLDRIEALGGQVDAVAGVELGGCPLASAVAFASFDRGRPLDAIYVRKSSKQHGTQRLLEGTEPIRAQASVVVVEDTVTTGASTLRAVARLREHDYQVPSVVAVVDRLEGGAEAIEAAGLTFTALYTRDDFMGAS